MIWRHCGERGWLFQKNVAWNWTRLFQGGSVRLLDLKFQLGTAANLPKYKQEELFKVDLLGSKVLAASSWGQLNWTYFSFSLNHPYKKTICGFDATWLVGCRFMQILRGRQFLISICCSIMQLCSLTLNAAHTWTHTHTLRLIKSPFAAC